MYFNTSLNQSRNLNFTSIKTQYNNPDNIARKEMMKHIEQTLFRPSREYDEQQLKYMGINFEKLSKRENRVYKNKTNNDEDTYETLKNAKIYAAQEVVKGKLYTGQSFITYNDADKVKVLKKAGIKTIVALVPSDLYEEKAKEEGINFTYLSDIGHGYLKTSSYEIIEDLVNNPKMYADNISRISDLKQYINILNNNDENYPGPIYMGCQNGTTRTFLWTRVYKILKDAPQDEPLDSKTVEQLKTLLDIWKNDY